jgi:hypothetical protein
VSSGTGIGVAVTSISIASKKSITQVFHLCLKLFAR